MRLLRGRLPSNRALGSSLESDFQIPSPSPLVCKVEFSEIEETQRVYMFLSP